MRGISIRIRILILISIAVIFALGVGGAFYAEMLTLRGLAVDTTQEAMLEGQKDKLQVAVHSMAVSMGEMIQGQDNPESIVEMIRKAVDPIRFEYDEFGYYFVYNETTNIALPPSKQLQGKDLKDLKDKNDVYIVQEMFANAKKGGGFIQYICPSPMLATNPNFPTQR